MDMFRNRENEHEGDAEFKASRSSFIFVLAIGIGDYKYAREQLIALKEAVDKAINSADAKSDSMHDMLVHYMEENDESKAAVWLKGYITSILSCYDSIYYSKIAQLLGKDKILQICTSNRKLIKASMEMIRYFPEDSSAVLRKICLKKFVDMETHVSNFASAYERYIVHEDIGKERRE